ncbi:deoxyribose-phosphate aldolase [Bacillus sp. REN10]|uniref:class I fructose-bisphosphate aldolase n=1 Tax=Bacillus sp. REN10 TaxID=2782541 RepID=UPI00193C2376|nr:deoxyribose-phosphate aldolase [Bacillus sp. REN10]
MGKAHRLNKLIDFKSQKSIFLPIDHGTTLGPLKGIRSLNKLVDLSAENNIQAIIAHQGVIQNIVSKGTNTKKIEFLLHISCSTEMFKDPSSKQIVSSIEHCLRLGAVGVSIHVNLGVEKENEMVKDLGAVCEKAYEWGLPVLAMINVHDQTDGASRKEFSKKISHGVRLAGELGSDFVKIQYPGNFQNIVDAVSAFDIPILLSGGENTENSRELFIQLREALDAGIKGACIGRNLFDAEHPKLISSCLSMIVHENKSIEEVWDYYESSTLQTKDNEFMNLV